jgi:periplasmic protein TonB
MVVDMSHAQITLWNLETHFSFAAVVLVHLAILIAIVSSTEEFQPIDIIAPSIQGVIIPTPPQDTIPEQAAPQPLPSPPKSPKPAATRTPLPKAAPSERAIEQEAQPEPIIANEQKPPIQETTTAPAEQLVMPHTDAAHINNPAPVYPVMSRRAREEGIVVLAILVLANGSVGEMRLTQSSGYKKLDQAAMSAIKNWQFVPAKRGDHAIDYWYEIPIEFSLKH